MKLARSRKTEPGESDDVGQRELGQMSVQLLKTLELNLYLVLGNWLKLQSNDYKYEAASVLLFFLCKQ